MELPPFSYSSIASQQIQSQNSEKEKGKKDKCDAAEDDYECLTRQFLWLRDGTLWLGKLLTQQQRTSPHIKHQQKRVDSQERTK